MKKIEDLTAEDQKKFNISILLAVGALAEGSSKVSLEIIDNILFDMKNVLTEDIAKKVRKDVRKELKRIGKEPK